MLMVVMGVATWMFPRPARDDTRYRPELAEAVYWVMTVATAVRALAELGAGLTGTSSLNATIVAPPTGTTVVCTLVAGGDVIAAWSYTRSKISPITWKDEVAFGPPTPKKMRTVSPTFAFIGCSAVSAPTAPLK